MEALLWAWLTITFKVHITFYNSIINNDKRMCGVHSRSTQELDGDDNKKIRNQYNCKESWCQAQNMKQDTRKQLQEKNKNKTTWP